MQSPSLPVPFSRYGARTIPISGSAVAIAGETAEIGSLRDWARSSSATGTVEKYENLLVSGIISPRKRVASSSTVNLERPGSLDIPVATIVSSPRAKLRRMPRKILVSAGESSGDFYASLVVEELRRTWPDAEFFGCTGPRLRTAGV